MKKKLERVLIIDDQLHRSVNPQEMFSYYPHRVEVILIQPGGELELLSKLKDEDKPVDIISVDCQKEEDNAGIRVLTGIINWYNSPGLAVPHYFLHSLAAVASRAIGATPFLKDHGVRPLMSASWRSVYDYDPNRILANRIGDPLQTFLNEQYDLGYAIEKSEHGRIHMATTQGNDLDRMREMVLRCIDLARLRGSFSIGV